VAKPHGLGASATVVFPVEVLVDCLPRAGRAAWGRCSRHRRRQVPARRQRRRASAGCPSRPR
jgi:hypothetical protein